MRIIAGTYRRRTLKAPSGHLTRPTTDRTRESLFNIIRSRLALEGAEVLDLFAGTGALGLEAISRGAAFVRFVEQQGSVLRYARENAEALGVADQGLFLRQDAVAFLEQYGGPPFDLILADPPYDLEALPELPDLALPHLKPHGLLTIEHDTRLFFDEHPALDTSRPYGRTIVSVFRPPVVETEEGASPEEDHEDL